MFAVCCLLFVTEPSEEPRAQRPRTSAPKDLGDLELKKKTKLNGEFKPKSVPNQQNVGRLAEPARPHGPPSPLETPHSAHLTARRRFQATHTSLAHTPRSTPLRLFSARLCSILPSLLGGGGKEHSPLIFNLFLTQFMIIPSAAS